MFFQAALDVWPLPRIPATKCDKPNQLLQPTPTLLATALSAATFQRPWLRLPFGALRPARKLNALEQEKKGHVGPISIETWHNQWLKSMANIYIIYGQ